MKYPNMQKRIVHLLLAAFATATFASSCEKPVVEPVPDPDAIFTMPPEESVHEGTWLQWPHNFGYDDQQVSRYESSWIEMTRALHTGEKVHLITYNASEQARVEALLLSEGMDMAQIDFFNWPTDDVWVRDNGPVFVRDAAGKLHITNWEFNGWGGKTAYENCNQIPVRVSDAIGVPRLDVAMVNEGGAVEIDGNGTLMAKKSCIINNNRNPGFTQADVESYFRKYLGVTNFIWLDGVAGLDITDDHIDGAARFANGQTIVTHSPNDSDPDEYSILQAATDVNGDAYEIVHLPLTQANVPGTNEKGIYMNFYVGNEVVLVPNYGDANDAAANAIVQGLYPDKTIVGIEAAKLAKDGGMVHCVTQQQPL